MVVSVQFKNKDKVFIGQEYDYLLSNEEEVPKKGSIIRMMDTGYNFLYSGTRVKVVGVKKTSSTAKTKIRYVEATLEDWLFIKNVV